MTNDEGRSTHWFTLLYTDFLLRDVFGKIVPGMLVIVVLFAVSQDDILAALDKLGGVDWWVWVGAIGPAWLCGFAVQSLGELVRVIRYFPPAPKNQTEEKHFREMYGDLRQIWSTASPRERMNHERLVVIKEACGIGGSGVAVVAILLAFRYLVRFWPFPWSWIHPPRLLAWLAIVACAGLLIRMHRHHIYRQKWFQDLILDKKGKP